MSRLAVYHHFDSPDRLLEALAWSVLERADIGRVRQACMDPDPSKALREFAAANAHFLATLGAQGRAVLATGLVEPDVRAVIQGTYVTARRAAIAELVDDSTRPAGFPLLVGRTGGRVPHGPHLPGAFETLTVHSGWATTDAAALLAELAARVLDAWRPPSTRQ